MKRRFKMMRLPILTKDLLERASRKRTYIIRFSYGLFLFVFACTLFYGNIGVSAEAGQALGRGAQHFALLMSIQLAVLYTLVPILAAGAIAAEKQQDTLALLLVTTLTPWQIVLQKFAARTASILSFVCLSFPLLAITYTFGGVTPAELVLGMFGLIASCLQLGALAILCSAYFRTTAQALAVTYVVFLILRFISSNAFLQPPGVAGIIFATFTALICLAVAAGVLVDRAFVQSRNYLLEFFRGLDRFFEQLNVLTGGVVLVHDRGFLPGRAPIQWRETRKKSLGTFRYLFRVLVVLEFPILFCIQLMRFSTNASNLDDGGLVALLDMLWIASVALVALHAASLISEERSHQTLGVLLSTPLPSRRILAEKLSGVRRLTFVLMVPFATIFLFEKWWYSRSSWDYVVLSALTVVIYLTVIRWTALAIGLRLPNQLSAIIGAISVIGLWVGGLALAGPLMSYLNIDLPPLENTIRAMSPVDMILAVQHSATYAVTRNGALSPWETSPAATVLHFVFYATLGFGLQWWCRRSADRYLGRIPEPQAPERWELEAAALETAPRLSVNVD
ncbi:MAG TPA: ABC transporter permease subunit [Planctomycetaceae bacterium]|jgi:ABC-type transport system involved in multi-copper enzyme maturation permease subunit|nr:ABC transporter permease subunit [Planctomycetaceae bacterium]